SPSNLDVIQRSVLHWFVRPSGVWFQQSLLVSPANMTSADFLAHRRRVYSKISLGKMNILVPIAATSTILVPFLIAQALDFGSMCYLILPHSLSMWFLFVSTDTAVWLTSVQTSRLTTLPLAWLRDVTPALKGLSPVGTLI